MEFRIQEGTALFVCAGDRDAVTISTENGDKTSPNTVVMSYEDWVKWSVQLLLLPEVATLAPHAALPEGFVFFKRMSLAASRDQIALVKKSRKAYVSKFGRSDMLGPGNPVRRLDQGETLAWGDVTLAGTKGALRLTAPGPFSIFILIDLAMAFLRDNRTTMEFEHYCVRHLRRWGEHAFSGTGLKPGIPEKLLANVSLQDDEAEEEESSTLIQSAAASEPPAPASPQTAPAVDEQALRAEIEAELRPRIEAELERKFGAQLDAVRDNLEQQAANKARSGEQAQAESRKLLELQEKVVAQATEIQELKTRKQELEENFAQANKAARQLNDSSRSRQQELETELAEARRAVDQALAKSLASEAALREECEQRIEQFRQNLIEEQKAHVARVTELQNKLAEAEQAVRDLQRGTHSEFKQREDALRKERKQVDADLKRALKDVESSEAKVAEVKEVERRIGVLLASGLGSN